MSVTITVHEKREVNAGLVMMSCYNIVSPLCHFEHGKTPPRQIHPH